MRILIIEDEDAAARRLLKLIKEIAPDVTVEASLDGIEASLNWLESNPMPDLIFMDIHLSDGSSFEIFDHMHIDKPIIFTTAYDQYAIQAFKVNAIDYLLKPIKKEELEVAIQKFKLMSPPQTFDYNSLAKAIREKEPNKRFLIRFSNQIRVVELEAVAYFYTQDKITFLINKEGKRYPIDYSLEKIEEMTDDNKFFRINRQFIINLDAIEEMYSYSKSRVKIILNPPCELETVVSTEKSPIFKKWLTGS